MDEDRALKGIVVDAGHGGADPGASGNGIVEKDYNLMISKYIFDRFKELNAPVKMTRTTDETLTPDERVKRVLNAFGNDPNVVVISNHLNAGGGDGAEVVYALRNKDTLAKGILTEIEKTGQNVRKYYQRRLEEGTDKDYYFIMRNTGVTEPVLVEYGFVDSANDATFIKNNWKKLAEATVKAVSLYKGIPYAGLVTEGYYTVVSGDTLWSVAKKLYVTVDALKSENNLTTNTLTIGQKLKIPAYVSPTTSEITYLVKAGDSLYSIAETYKTTVDDIKKLNNLTSNVLSIGQTLKIPKSIPSTSKVEYVVKSGDSLYSIAQRFITTVSTLRTMNNLTSDLLSIGQILLVPSTGTTTPTNTYVVKAGDTLWSIATKYNTTPSQIMSLNNLTNSTLSLGQILIVP